MKDLLIAASVLLNLAAVIGPVYSLYVRYGISERISAGAESVNQLIAISAAMLAAFATAWLASSLFKRSETTYTSVLSTIAKTITSSTESSKKAA